MGTMAIVAVLDKNGSSLRATTVHWDGQLNGVGATLNAHYMTTEIIERLISMGDVSSLRRNIDPEGEHSFNNPEDDCTIFYHRDRGEKLNVRKFKSIDKLREWSDCSYIYVWVGHTWMVSVNNSRFFPLGCATDLSVDDNNSIFGA